MTHWWELTPNDPENAPTLIRAVAYYRHSAQDRQENSIPIQRDQVREWAEKHGVEIVEEFAEQGYWAGGKPPCGLQRLLLDEAREPVHILVPGQRKPRPSSGLRQRLASTDFGRASAFKADAYTEPLSA